MATPEQLQQAIQKLEARTVQLETQFEAAVERERVNSTTIIGWTERIQGMERMVSDPVRGNVGERVSRLEAAAMETSRGHTGKEKN